MVIEVRHLCAIEEIKILKSRYFYYVDSKQWAHLESLFTDDCRFDLPEIGVCNRHNFIELIKPTLIHATSVHQGFMPDIRILDDDRAEARWSMEDNLRWPADRPWKGKYTALRGFGYYFETYARVAGEWRISALKLVRCLEEVN